MEAPPLGLDGDLDALAAKAIARELARRQQGPGAGGGQTLGYLESLEREAHGDPHLQFLLATAYRKTADVLVRTSAANPGDTQAALANHQRAERLLRQTVAARPEMESAHLELAGVMIEQGWIHAYAGDRSQATSWYKGALEAAGTLGRSGPVSGKARQGSMHLLEELR